VYVGNVIRANDEALVVLHEIEPVFVSFAVPEHHLPEIRREMRRQALRLTATFDGLSGAAPEGEVTFVDNTVNTTTGTIQLKATFPNTDHLLWPGQFVQVELRLAQVPRAVVVPSQAIQIGQNHQYIFVVKPDQTVEMREVEAGVTFHGETAVAGNLKPGETVVTDGQLNLVPGRKVEARTAPASAAARTVAE
jgi:multidrug efflux system membrane fusion protein